VYVLIPLSIIPGIDDIMLFMIVIVVAVAVVAAVVLVRFRRRKPAAPTTAPAPVRVEKVTAPPTEKLDEDVVRLKVEKTATESALKSLESALKEGAITKETFEKYKSTYSERLAKIDSELSKRSKVGITKLEGEIDKVRQSYLDKLKELSKKAISVKPIASAPVSTKPVTQTPRVAPPAVTKAPTRLPEIPLAPATVRQAPKEDEFAKPPVRPSVPPATKPLEIPPQQSVTSAAKAAPSGPASISDLRREMMDELNRLKRLIGRAGA
jgi:hypothetical protein